MFFLETDAATVTLFIALLITLLLAFAIILLIIFLKVNELFPFRKMKDDHFDDCYDLNQINKYANDVYEQRKSIKKKK